MAPAYEPSAVNGSTDSSRDSAMNCASSPRKKSPRAGDAPVEGLDADDRHHVFGRDAGVAMRLLEPRPVLEHELRALGDALFGEEALAVLPPGRHLFRGLGDQLDDLGLRLGLGEQAVDLERFDLLRRGGGVDELADLRTIEVEAVTAGERSVREGGTGDP